MNQTFQSSANMASQAPPPTQPTSYQGSPQGQQTYQQGNQVYSVQGSSAMAPAPMYQPQQGYPNNVIQFPQPTTPTAPTPSAPTSPPDYMPAMQPGMYQNPPPGMGYSPQAVPQPQPTPSLSMPSSQEPQGESGWKQAFHSLANMLATPVWGQGGQSSPSPSSLQGQPSHQGWGQTQGMPAQAYQQGAMAMPTSYGNPAYGQGYSQPQQPQYLPQPGSADAPLSYMQADPNMPNDAELAAVGYSAATLNQYATEVEDQLLGLAERHQSLGNRHHVICQKYAANSTILTDPHILANYVVDFNKHVDGSFMTRVADYFDQSVGIQTQGEPQSQPAEQYQLGQPGYGPTQLGSGMITPEMLSTHDVIIPSNFNKLTQPMLQGTSQQQAMMMAQQQAAQYPLQQPNAGVRVAAPGMPQHGQQVTSDDIYAGLRQSFAMNPAQAWQQLRQVEQMYGPGAIAKPLVTV